MRLRCVLAALRLCIPCLKGIASQLTGVPGRMRMVASNGWCMLGVRLVQHTGNSE